MRNSLLIVVSTIIFFLSFALHSLGQDDDVYYELASDGFSERECEKFALRTTRKINWLANRLKKSNQEILDVFQEKQEILFQNLCLENEEAAEQLILNASYSRNRFSNICSRSIDDTSSRNDHGIEELVFIEGFVSSIQGEGCNCHGLDSLKTSITALKIELKKQEQLNGFVQEQTKYLESVLGKFGAGLKEMTNLQKEAYYFTEFGKEYLNVFKNSQTRLLGMLSGMGWSPQMASVDPRLQSSGVGNLSISELGEEKEFPLMGFLGSVENASNKAKESSKNELLDIQNLSLTDSIGDVGVDSLINPNTEWTPNPLRTKRFVDRLEYGINFQVNRKTVVIPQSIQLNTRLSYRVSMRSFIGVGLSFSTSHRSENIRDWKIETFGKDLYISNYTSSVFSDFRLFQNTYLTALLENQNVKINYVDRAFSFPNNSTSILAGLKIKSDGRGKIQPTMELLFDFMHDSKGTPLIVFRSGFNFRTKNAYKN